MPLNSTRDAKKTFNHQPLKGKTMEDELPKLIAAVTKLIDTLTKALDKIIDEKTK